MYINRELLNDSIEQLSADYSNGKPFPFVSIDQFLTNDSIQKIATDFPEVSDSIWTHYIHYNERKHGLTKWEHFPKSIQELLMELRDPKFIAQLEQITGIKNLLPDPDFEGSGLHQTLRGGFLNIHADFTVHPKRRKWRRRLNVLLYVGEDWNPKWGGALEFWNEDMSQCVQKIDPVQNRLVIFGTGTKTYHGYPEPLTCPENTSRKSIAMYFYTEEKNFQKSATDYRPRPEDGRKKWLIKADNILLSTYSSLKGIFGINDDWVSKVLNRFQKDGSK